jgi:hypothetical protein
MATAIVQAGVSDPALGVIDYAHIQVCPQNFGEGKITEQLLDKLQDFVPESKIRLHANTRIMDHSCQYDAGTISRFPEYTQRLTAILKHLGTPYTLHAANNGVPLLTQLEAVSKLSDATGVPVGIEGLYPSKYARNTLKVWDDYELLLMSDCFYAIDLSHLNIIRQNIGNPPQGLLESLIQDPKCIEIHVSGNDGIMDSHLPCTGKEWWMPLLNIVSDNTVIFYEGRIPKETYQ